MKTIEINDQLTKDEILSHTAEIIETQIPKHEHNRALLIALGIGVALGLCC